MRIDLATANDTELVSAISDGHEPALAEVFRRHGNAVAGLARRLLGEGSFAEDVTQEVFVKLWKEPGRFDPNRGKLLTLLLTQTHGRAVDLIRANNARQRREDRVAAEPQPPMPDVDAELIAVARSEQVREALNALPPEEKVPIELAYYGGNTYKEVATLLGVPEGTVKTRIRTGLRRLNTVLTNSDHDHEHRLTYPATASTPADQITGKDKSWN